MANKDHANELPAESGLMAALRQSVEAIAGALEQRAPVEKSTTPRARVSQRKRMLMDGPYIESKELIGTCMESTAGRNSVNTAL